MLNSVHSWNMNIIIAARWQNLLHNLKSAIVKPKQTGSCGRGIRNEHNMSITNTILIWNTMEQIQFIYFQDYMKYYTVHHNENSTYMEIWHRGWWCKLSLQLPVCFGFTIVNLVLKHFKLQIIMILTHMVQKTCISKLAK